MENVVNADQITPYPIAQIASRGLVVSVVLGTTLTLITQPDAAFGDAKFEKLQTALMFITPFFVVSISQIFGIREGRRARSQGVHPNKGFVTDMFSHGIPLRAAGLGLATGIINTSLAATEIVMAGQSLAQLSVGLIAQALFLPMSFGAISQTLSFRRTLG